MTTDERGLARFDVPRRALDALGPGGSPAVWARSRGAGLLPRSVLHTVPPAEAPDLDMQLVAQAGALIRGRVVGPDGRPAAAMLQAWSADTSHFVSVAGGRTDAEGHFEIECRTEGTLTLLAEAGTPEPDAQTEVRSKEHLDLGTGASAPFVVAFGEPTPFVEVHISGPGVLRGRVRDDDGRPAAGLDLLALVAALDDERGSFRLDRDRHAAAQLEGRGHVWVTTTTDAEGAFEIRGLRSDLYNLRARDQGEGSATGYPELLTPRPIPSQGQTLDLRLTRTYLAIHVRDARGGLPEQEILSLPPTRWSQRDAWPAELTLQVTLAPTEARQVVPTRRQYLWARPVGPGEFVTELPRDAFVGLDVALFGDGRRWSSRRLDVPAGAGRVDVSLVIPERQPSGSLGLDVVDAHGAPLVDHLRVRILEPRGGTVMLDTEGAHLDEDDWPLERDLPAGEYVLHVAGTAWVDSHHGTLVAPREHGDCEVPLVIAPGRRTPVRAVLSEVARLDVKLVGSVGDDDRAAIRRQRPDLAEQHVEAWAREVTLWLERDGRWCEPVQFVRALGEGTGFGDRRLFSTLELGTQGLSELVAPGDYTLAARRLGGRVWLQSVRLAPGQTLAVTIDLD